MTLCPRCGANNDTALAACWNCYAPLQGPLAARVKPMNLVGNADAVMAEPAAAPDDPTMGVPPPPPPKKKGLFGKK